LRFPNLHRLAGALLNREVQSCRGLSRGLFGNETRSKNFAVGGVSLASVAKSDPISTLGEALQLLRGSPIRLVYGLGRGVGRPLGVGRDLGVGVGLGVAVGVGLGVAVAVGVTVGVGVVAGVGVALGDAVGVGVGVAACPPGNTRT